MDYIKKSAKPNLQAFADKWKAPYVSRGEIYTFSGGLITPKTIANLDSLGLGPAGRLRIGGRRIGYEVNELVRWLESRSERVEN